MNNLIKMLAKAFTYSLLLLLTACTQIHSQLVLDQSFVNQAEKFTPKKPFLLVPESNLEQSFGGYKVEDTKTSSTKFKTKIIRQKSETKIKLESLTRLSIGELKRQALETTGTMDFSFKLSKLDTDIEYRSSCESTFFNKDTNIIYDRFLGKNTSMNSVRRINTTLICDLTPKKLTAQGPWTLILVSDRYNNIAAYLANYERQIELTPLMNATHFIIKNGEKIPRDSPSAFNKNSGVMFEENGRKLATLSLIDDHDVYLIKHLADTEKTLLTSAAYSLLMFQWHVSNWRK